MKIITIITDVTLFYLNGFRQMKLGKRLWMVIGIKLLILFGVMKLFFFPDYLSSHYPTDEARSHYLMHQFTKERK